jgi:hypothetical protein
MKRVLALGLMVGLLAAGLRSLAADSKPDPKKVKEGLQELGEFIGEWNASGGPVVGNKGIWKETVNWGWRFKGDDCWLTVDFKDGKLYKSGEMRYLPDKKLYQLTVTTADGKKQAFEGELKSSNLTLEFVDPATKATQQLVMNTAAEGVRFIYRVNTKAEGTTIWKKEFLVQATKVGQALGPKEKKNLCIVSGGVGTSTVSYKGQTYYVCCSGCRDAFNENPEKYIKEWEAKKGKQ